MLMSYYQRELVLLNMMMRNISCLFILFFSINLFGVENDKYMDANNLKELISSQEIAQKIKDISLQIDNDYKDKNITFLILLKGAVCFASDLIKEVKTPSTLEFISCSSYGKNGTKRGDLFVEGLDKLDLSNKHVLIVDDIYDSGTTLTKVREKVLEKNLLLLNQYCC
jgi:hypoxanthine-guanine phosphoribosyltransferase